MAPLIVRPVATEDVEPCARLMSESEPWITLGRGFEASLVLLQDRGRETHVAWNGQERAGFIVLCLVGAFAGYIQSVCVAPDFRGKGVGTELIRFAEERIFREFPNVFLCVSSFNHRAARLYERLGYEVVGELKDYLVAGHSEILMRKTIGPIGEFVRPGVGGKSRDCKVIKPETKKR
jgi:[ribosomal protein S18]-alanine N-acetyltransferase